MNMNWGVWLQGAVAALSSGIMTSLVALAVLSSRPPAWELFVIAGVPTSMGFLSYCKQSPPPFGFKLVKETAKELAKGRSKRK